MRLGAPSERDMRQFNILSTHHGGIVSAARKRARKNSTTRIVTVAVVRIIPSFSMRAVCSATILHHFVFPLPNNR